MSEQAQADPERLRVVARRMRMPHPCPNCDLSVGHVCDICEADNQLILAARTIEQLRSKLMRTVDGEYVGPDDEVWVIETIKSWNVIDGCSETLRLACVEARIRETMGMPIFASKSAAERALKETNDV